MTSPAGFEELGLQPALRSALERLDLHELTPLQAAVLPRALEGRDILVEGGTEDERTVCLAVAVLQSVQILRAELQTLILAPSEERARQLVTTLTELGKNPSLRVVSVAGDNADLEREARKLDPKPHVLIGTAHSLVDHLYRGSFSTDGVRLAVLDRVDEMGQRGLLEDAETLCSCLLAARQYLLFAAKMPQEVKVIYERYLHQPVRISTAGPPSGATEPTKPTAPLAVLPAPAKASAPARPAAPEPARHLYRNVGAPQKTPFLCDYIKDARPRHAVVVCGTKQSAENVAERLGREGLVAELWSGAPAEGQLPVGSGNGTSRIVVAAEPSTSEMDLSVATHLIHFSVPKSAEAYLQRVGLSTKAANFLTLVSPVEKKRFEEIQAGLPSPLTPVENGTGAVAPEAPSPEAAASEAASVAEPVAEESSNPSPIVVVDMGSVTVEEDPDLIRAVPGRESTRESGRQHAAPGDSRRQSQHGPRGQGDTEVDPDDPQGLRRRRRRRRRRRGDGPMPEGRSGPARFDAPQNGPAIAPRESGSEGPRPPRDQREQPRRDQQRRRDDGFRRSRPHGSGDSIDREPNFNRKGVAPEPPAASTHNSGMLIGENRDRWQLKDRRGRTVKRPWLSEDDKNQRLYGNQAVPEGGARRRPPEDSAGRRGGGPADESGRFRRRGGGGFRNEGGSDLSGRRNPRRRHPRSSGEGQGPRDGGR